MWMTWWLLALALIVALGAAALWFYVPQVLHERALYRIADEATNIASLAENNKGEGLRLEDATAVAQLLDKARLQHDLYYLIITDGTGIPQAGFNYPGANYVGFRQVDHATGALNEAGTVYRTRLPVTLRDDQQAVVHVGLSFVSNQEEMRLYRKMLGSGTLFLLVLALGLIGTSAVVRRREENQQIAEAELLAEKAVLEQQQHTLEAELDQQRHAEEELRQSEERYRGLFENAMETAYQDLEALNKDLESQKNDLEREVIERKRAEVALRDEVLQKKKAEMALRQSEERWRLLVESHPEPILIMLGDKIAYINKAGASVFGAKNQKELIRKSLLDFVPQHQQASFRKQIIEYDGETASTAVESVLRRLDGKERFIVAYVVPVVHAGQRASQIVVRDITEQRLGEVALRRYTERLKALNKIERSMLGAASPQTVADLALDHLRKLTPLARASVIEYEYFSGEGVILAAYASHKSTMLSGARIPLHMLANVKADDPNATSYVNDLLAKAKLEPVEQALVAEGIRSYVHVPLIVHGEVVGTLNLGALPANAFSDEHIKIAREVADLLAVTLRQARLDAERELYESELIAAKEHAEEMARLKSAFLTNMSHEIRTPLSGIIGFAQVLHEEVTIEHREFVELIEESARRLLDTINSVLDLARLESGRMNMVPEPLNLASQAEHAVRLLQSLADRKNLRLDVLINEQQAWCKVDKASFDRVVNNLVGNAIKFTHQGGVRVEISADNANVYMSVHDSGVGISEDFLPHLFDEFRQEEAGADRSHEGSGLGLAITSKLVGRMGGVLSVESEKGIGSTFTVRFPRVHHEDLEAEKRTTASFQANGVRPKLLIVEDKDDAKFLLDYLLRSNFDATLAPDLNVAMRLARNTQFDVVLMDIMLGEEEVSAGTLAQFRRLPGYQNVPLVAMATQVLPSSWDELIERGFNSYIANPFLKDTLMDALYHILMKPSGPNARR